MEGDRQPLHVAERLSPLRFIAAGRADDHLQQQVTEFVGSAGSGQGYCFVSSVATAPTVAASSENPRDS